jgi:hypothetical protein
MDGHVMEAHIAGEITGDSMSGTISLQNTPPLPFTGSKE